MKIILFYEHISREMASCERIINEVNKYDGIEIFKFSVIFEYYDAVSLAKTIGIDMLIMPWLHSDKDYELVMPFIHINPKLYVVNMHHEQILSEFSKDVLLPKDASCKNNVIHFVWGENFKKELQKCGVEEDLIYVTGNVRSDTIIEHRDKETDKKQFAQVYGLDPQKKWLLYSENRDWIWGNKKNVSKVYISSGCTASEFEEFYQETVRSLDSTIKDIKLLDDDFFTTFELIYRPHPGTLIQKNFDTRIHTIAERSIYEWLQVVDANIVSGSTSIFESDMFGVATFVDNSFQMPQKYQAIGMSEYPKVNSIGCITEQLITENKKNLSRKKIFEKYIGISDGKAAYRTANYIYRILKEGNPKYKNANININYVRYVLKYLREKVTKFIVEANLLPLIKFPKFAYRMQNDIPYLEKGNKIE